MSTTILDTAVIGAGAAGLLVGRRLAERDQRFELFDENARVGDSWRARYRSLRLFSARRFASLPGLRIDIGRFDYPTGMQLADYLERYAQHFQLPVRSGVRVVRLVRVDGRFRLDLSDGSDVLADRVVVTAGAHRIPVTPAWAGEIDPDIRQLHSIDYRGPEQLAEGPVLVVGAGNSGTDIALEAARAGHAVTIAGRHPGQVPADIDTRVGNLVSGVFINRLRRLTIDTGKGRAAKAAIHGHGIMLVRNKLADLERAGVVRVPRLGGTASGRPITPDGTPIDAATVVWSTGSRPDVAWIEIDGVLDAGGEPLQERGIATACPALGFVGLDFQYSAASSTLPGMDRDAAFVVDALLATDAVAARLEAPTAAS